MKRPATRTKTTHRPSGQQVRAACRSRGRTAAWRRRRRIRSTRGAGRSRWRAERPPGWIGPGGGQPGDQRDRRDERPAGEAGRWPDRRRRAASATPRGRSRPPRRRRSTMPTTRRSSGSGDPFDQRRARAAPWRPPSGPRRARSAVGDQVASSGRGRGTGRRVATASGTRERLERLRPARPLASHHPPSSRSAAPRIRPTASHRVTPAPAVVEDRGLVRRWSGVAVRRDPMAGSPRGSWIGAAKSATELAAGSIGASSAASAGSTPIGCGAAPRRSPGPGSARTGFRIDVLREADRASDAVEVERRPCRAAMPLAPGDAPRRRPGRRRPGRSTLARSDIDIEPGQRQTRRAPRTKATAAIGDREPVRAAWHPSARQ